MSIHTAHTHTHTHTNPQIYDFNVPRYDLGRNATADIVYTANIPLLGALEKARSISPQAAVLLAGYVKTFSDPHNIGIFMGRTPHEMLWGYEVRGRGWGGGGHICTSSAFGNIM